MSENSMTAEEVAQILNITKNTVYEMVKRGELNAYRVGKRLRIEEKDIIEYKEKKKQRPVKQADRPFIICGTDTILDILARNMETQNPGTRILRSYKDSYYALIDLYNGDADASATHMWDGDTDTYNTVYARCLLPGIPVKKILLAKRNVGFYVKAGNPKNINGWEDFLREDLKFENREKGSGIRVLIDERLKLMRIDPASVSGYDSVSENNALAASAVAGGSADFSVGGEKSARKVKGVDFVFLQQECYDLIVRAEDAETPIVQSMLKIIESDEYAEQVSSLYGYERG